MTEQAVDMEIPTETFTHGIKKILFTALFLSFQGFFFERFSSYANFRLFVVVVSFCCFSMQT